MKAIEEIRADLWNAVEETIRLRDWYSAGKAMGAWKALMVCDNDYVKHIAIADLIISRVGKGKPTAS